MNSFGIIGFGEVGGIFARDLAAQGAAVAVFDVAPAAQARSAAAGVAAAGAHNAAHGAVVFVCVTVGSALEAVRSLAGGLGHAPFVVDVNSVSPATKVEAARLVEAAGGRYVEAAVMTSVPPKGLGSPMRRGSKNVVSKQAFPTPRTDGRIGAVLVCGG